MKNVASVCEIFSKSWWENVVETWNNSPKKNKFSKLGFSRFEISHSKMPSTLIYWDTFGIGSVMEHEVDNNVTFSAMAKDWKSFIRGDFNAVVGVLSGKIKFKGSALFILPYSEGFTLFSEIAKSCTSKDDLQESDSIK